MAINTKARRASVQAYTFGLMRPPPDGTVDEGDRATVAWFYKGLDYDNPTITVGIMSWFLNFMDFVHGSFGGDFK